jgi:hypothetical protein
VVRSSAASDVYKRQRWAGGSKKRFFGQRALFPGRLFDDNKPVVLTKPPEQV